MSEETKELGWDFGFSAVDSPPIAHLEAEKVKTTSLATQLEQKCQDVDVLRSIIVPLFQNLIKTADQEYLFWPNRAKIVQEQLDKVLAITDRKS